MEAELVSLNRKLQAAGRERTCRNEYAKLINDEERFSYTLDLVSEYDITPTLEPEVKSSKISERYRKTGNELFVSSQSHKSRDEILQLYTMSVAYAEPESSELAFAYGNRSALFFDAGLYDHCVIDIERALHFDYPEHLRIKLLNRRDRCLGALEEESQKINADTPKNLEDSKKYGKEKIHERRLIFDEAKFKPPIPSDNKEIPGVSGALEISYDEKFGRHIRATRKIEPGEVLGIQGGYATILAPEMFYSHCSNCLRQTWSSVPCEKCPQAIYCDENCRDEAWKNHHDVECRVVGALLRMGFNLLGLMSLRLAIRAVRDVGSFQNLRDKLDALDSWAGLESRKFTLKEPQVADLCSKIFEEWLDQWNN